MKITIIFPSRESEDISFGGCYIPCFAWVQGNKIIKEFPDSPHYPNDALKELLIMQKIEQRIPSNQRDLVIVAHPSGHGEEEDINSLEEEARILGFKPKKVLTELSEIEARDHDDDKITASLFASEFRELVSYYMRSMSLDGNNHKITQTRVADDLKLSTSAFSKLMSGSVMPSRVVMRKITDFFGRYTQDAERVKIKNERQLEKAHRLKELEKEILELDYTLKEYISKSESCKDRLYQCSELIKSENLDEIKKEKLESEIHYIEENIKYLIKDIQFNEKEKSDLTNEKKILSKEVLELKRNEITEDYSSRIKASIEKLKSIYLGGR